MKIAILEMNAGDLMATGERGRAIARFLRERGHEVDVMDPSPGRLRDFARFRFSLWSRLKRRAMNRQSLPHLWDYIADEMEGKLRAGRYDAVIARAQPVAYVLTRELACLKVVDVANVGFLELYHSAGQDPSELETYYEKEMEAYHAADYILSPHGLFTDFFRENVYDTDKIVTARLGCYLSNWAAQYSSNPRIVYAGSYGQIQDPYLLSLLAKRSPYAIDCYGSRDPNYRFLPCRLNYRGCRQTLDFLAYYQFGLITVSRDRLRENSPATKFAYYFAHGLPVLFPEWMKEGHSYEAAIPYNEHNFVEQVRLSSESKDRWQRLSSKARSTAEGLTWDRVLAPLDDLLARDSAPIGKPDATGVKESLMKRGRDARARSARGQEAWEQNR